MKIQHLAVIFILIIMPFSLIFSEYISNQVKVGQTEITYNNKLLNASYDAMKSYQLNTINNSVGDRSNSKIDDLESAVNIFYNSLTSSFGYTGYKATVMEEYVPVVAFTLYDGYYIYQPYLNTLTGLTEDDFEESYSEDNEIRNGVKTYVYYNQRYTKGNNDFVITYTLDNYITIEGTVDGDYVYKSGYLLNGITETKNGGEYIYEYDGIKFSNSNTESEQMSEYIDGVEYPYVKIDGTKFYLELNGAGKIFYLDSAGNRQIQADINTAEETYYLYYFAITKNKSAYIYYRDSYNFTNWVMENIGDLSSDDAEGNTYTKIDKIFDGDIQSSDSNFYRHKSEVIRKNIETNLSTAITSFNGGYILPKLSETDWELVENNVCMLTFLQGLSIGSKIYNGYCVVPNSLTKEYVDENDIYILTKSNTYCRANDKTLNDSKIPVKDNVNNFSYAGRLKLDFEKKTLDAETNKKYYPIRNYLASYTSIVGSSYVDNITEYKDMYGYMKNKDTYLKRTYYTALARERMSVYNVNNGLKEEDKQQVAIIKGGYRMPAYIDNWFYLKEYRTAAGVELW